MSFLSKAAILPFHAEIILAITCFGVVLICWRLVRPRALFPPGPPGNLLGNTLPKAFAYRHFERWTQEYGPIFSIRQGLTTSFVVGRLQAAIDILEKEGAVTADRPRNIVAGEILSGGMRLVHTPYGERFKRMRRAFHAHLQLKTTLQYAPLMNSSAKQLILDILETPERHQDHVKRYAASVVLALAYGRKTESSDDPVVKEVYRCTARIGRNFRPGLWKVDTYPFFRYIPGYLKELKQGHAEELALFSSQLNYVCGQIERGEAPPSFGKYLIERQKELELSDNEAAYLAGSMFGAGSDTTASSISTSMLAAACYPREQQWVWEEIESVVGKDKPPTLMDQDSLPRTMAWVLELFRWRPAIASGISHKAMKDIIWNGYLIPKGATIIGNIWSIGRDPEYFSDPEMFKPQRWLTESGQLRDDLKPSVFGFGRRICPGQHIATASVFLTTALLLWSYKISAHTEFSIDEWDFTDTASAHPMPFRVIFEPRAAPSSELKETVLCRLRDCSKSRQLSLTVTSCNRT